MKGSDNRPVEVGDFEPPRPVELGDLVRVDLSETAEEVAGEAAEEADEAAKQAAEEAAKEAADPAPPGAAIGALVGAGTGALSGDKVGASVVAITGGTATATSMRAAADGIAFPTDIAIELIWVCELVCSLEQRSARAYLPPRTI